MPRKQSKLSSALVFIILIAAVGLWIFDVYRQGSFDGFSQTEEEATSSKGKSQEKRESSDSPSSTLSGKYETYRNCTLVSDRGNDGDSFKVKLPTGRTETMRLYFVDSPESDFKTYRGGQNNQRRIDDQAEDLGRISPQQAVDIGKKAKEFTLTHLGKAPFTVHTEWDSPFKDQRYHAFIEVFYYEKPRFLHELLVEKGYARIHTKGASMPDGTPERKQEDHLLDLEKSAKSKKTGAWSL